MDFHLDEDQSALQETVSQFCESRWPIDGLAERPHDAFDRNAWNEFVDLGLPGLLADPSHGGLGLGCVEASIAFEQLGRHLVPGPLLWSVLAGLVDPDVASGASIATGVDARGAGPWSVEHVHASDVVLVLRDDAVVRVTRAAIDADAADEPLDPLTPTALLAALPDGEIVAGADDALRLARTGTVLAASLQLGIAQSALDVAVAYSLEREQFDVPIGSFQALKHIMADMYVRVGLARSAAYAAAAVLDDPSVGHLDRSLAGAKLLAGEAAVENGKAAVQILGGMGFTWEMAPHFFLKRAIALDHDFGSPKRHALAISESLAGEAS